MNVVSRRETFLRQGFSLIQVSMIIAVASILMVAAIPSGNKGGDTEKVSVTRERMKTIETMLEAFMASNLRLPCPADGSITVKTSGYGVEAATPGTCTGANFGTGNIVAGMVPVRSLGLTDEYAVDGYNRRLMYVVDKRATLTAATAPSATATACYDLQSQGIKGDIGILATSADTTVKENVMWALVSEGKSGHGAYPMEGGTTRIDASDGNLSAFSDDTLMNAFVTSSFVDSFTGQLVQKIPDPTTKFDSIVWYGKNTKNTCCLGKMCTFGFELKTAATSASVGYPLAKGDINGDTYEDLIVSDPTASTAKVYVIFGSKTGLPSAASRDISFITGGGNSTGAYGVAIQNDSSITGFGKSIAAGDINADGYDDMVIGGYPLTVIFGDKTGTFGGGSNTILTQSLNGTTGFLVNYIDPGSPGPGAVATGDIDGDGYKDIIFAKYLTGADAGGGDTWCGGANYQCLIVIYGNTIANLNTLLSISGTPATALITDITTLNSATTGFTITAALMQLTGRGYFSLAAGDVNGDGYDDIISGGSLVATRGLLYLMFGRSKTDWATFVPTNTIGIVNFVSKKRDGTAETLPASTTTPNGIKYYVSSDSYYVDINNYGSFGNAATAADINSDGIKDVVISDYEHVYIMYGHSTAWTVNAAATPNNMPDDASVTINTGTDRPTSSVATTAAVPSVVRTPDINGDGKPDLVLGVGAFSPPSRCYTRANAGGVYVVFQPAAGWASENLFKSTASTVCDSDELNLTVIGGSDCTTYPYTCGFRIDGANAGDTAYMPLALDINRDSKIDLAISAPGYNGNTGAIFTLYGRKTVPWSNAVDLKNIDY